MALKSETASPPNGMVNVINQESGGGADDLEDGEIFDDDDEDVPVPTAASSPPAPPPPPTISLDDKRRLSPLRRPLPTRPRRPKRPRDDDRPFRSSKQRRRSEENEKREKTIDEDDLLRDISPLRGNEWVRIHHKPDFMDDGMDDEDDDLGRRGRGFGAGRSRRGRNNRGGRRGGGRRENTQLCKFYLQGKCQRGSECPFSHNQTRKFELCKFYMMDCCAKKDKCLFMHSEFPCKYYYLGKKCYAGKKCKYSHGKISSQLRSALLRDSKECDFLQEKEEPPRSRRDRDRDRDREREKDREHREHRDRDKRDDKDKSHNFRGEHRTGSSDEEGNRTPMPSPSQDNSSDRDSRSRTPELDDHHSDHSNRSDPHLPDHHKDSEIGDEITPSIPADLPKRQRELYKRIQQQQREVESVQSGEDIEEREEDYKEEDWYSSEDEDGSKKIEPLTAILNKLKQKPVVPESQPTTDQSVPLPPTSQPAIIVPPILPDIDINEVSKLLSSVRETIQQKQNIENQNKTQGIPTGVPTILGQPPQLPPLGSLMPDTVPSVEKRRVRDPRLRGNLPEDDVDFRMAPQGDVDLRQLPFKPAPVHTPANEIDASINSHPPVPYKLIPVVVAPPDYSDITSKYVNDPRLRRHNPGAMAMVQPALMQPLPLRPTLEPRDPRQRGLLANDPRRKSSVLLQRDSDLRQPPHHFPQLGDVDLRMHPPAPHLAFK